MDTDWNCTTSFPGFPTCRWYVVIFLSLDSHVTQVLKINICIYYIIYWFYSFGETQYILALWIHNFDINHYTIPPHVSSFKKLSLFHYYTWRRAKMTLQHIAKFTKFCNQIHLKTPLIFVSIMCEQVDNCNYVVAKWEK